MPHDAPMPDRSPPALCAVTVNELHARPFPSLTGALDGGLRAAIKEPVNAAEPRPGAGSRASSGMLDRHGARHPQPEATHYSGSLGSRRAEMGKPHRIRHLLGLCAGHCLPAPLTRSICRGLSCRLVGRCGSGYARMVSLLVRVDVMPEDEARLSCPELRRLVRAGKHGRVPKVVDGAAHRGRRFPHRSGRPYALCGLRAPRHLAAAALAASCSACARLKPTAPCRCWG